MGCDGESEFRCSDCDNQLKLEETNYFLYIPIVNQLKLMLKKYWTEIKEFDATIQCSDNQQYISDVHSAILLMDLTLTKKHILSIMINTDGVSLKKSNNASFWPLQIICNFLPPNLRYQIKNIIVTTLYYSNKKPNMDDLFKPFAEEMNALSESGIIVNNEFFALTVTHAIFDLPARAAFQKLRQYNGHDACPYCFHHGEAVDKGVRYTYSADEIEIRTYQSFLDAYDNVRRHRNDENYADHGVYAISPAIAFEHFDLAHSFGIDYMHCILLGVAKRTHEIWLNPSLHHDSHLSKNLQDELNQRICSIKPCQFISRLPRSLENRRSFKASEYRSLLLYYLPVCLRGILKKKYLDHFNLLSSSIYKLLGTNITSDDLNAIEENLKTFVEQYEELYGKNNMKMNVHLILHLTSSVKYLGPLWSISMFAFESNNAMFGQCVKGNTDIIAQITTKYVISKSNQKNHLCKKKTEICDLEAGKFLPLGSKDVQTLQANNIYVEQSNNKFKIYCFFKKK